MEKYKQQDEAVQREAELRGGAGTVSGLTGRDFLIAELSSEAGISRRAAKSIVADYFKRNPDEEYAVVLLKRLHAMLIAEKERTVEKP